MSIKHRDHGRPDNTEKVKVYLQDDQQPFLYSPTDTTGNKFLGQWNKVFNTQNMLLHENKEKYLNEYMARYKAKIELGTIPMCFNQCVTNLETAMLNSAEKNCVRECYLKRVTAKDDMNILFQQKLAIETSKEMKDDMV